MGHGIRKHESKKKKEREKRRNQNHRAYGRVCCCSAYSIFMFFFFFFGDTNECDTFRIFQVYYTRSQQQRRMSIFIIIYTYVRCRYVRLSDFSQSTVSRIRLNINIKHGHKMVMSSKYMRYLYDRNSYRKSPFVKWIKSFYDLQIY